MIVTPQPVQLVLPSSVTPRSEGIHMSGIIRSIAIQSGILDIDEDWSMIQDSREITDPVAISRISMGLAWEEWYTRTQLPEVVDHPGEMEVDEVFMTPDGEELTRIVVDRRPLYRPKVHEIKLTYKSMHTVFGTDRRLSKRDFDWSVWDDRSYDSSVDPIGPLANQWMWMAQLKGYCKAKDTNLGALHALFVDSDYSYPMRPTPYRFDIEFTQEEIDDNWTLLTEHRDYVMGMHKDDTPF